MAGPPEFNLDTAGGLFVWTPADIPFADGREEITIRIRNTNGAIIDEDQLTFDAYVDNNSMANPVWRDYISDQTTVSIKGRAAQSPYGP